MKELSIFIDESGDFGEYKHHSPFYLVTLVFHDQSIDITSNLQRLHNAMSQRDLPDYTVHAGPLIRREGEYENFLMEERTTIFKTLFHFVRTIDISYYSIATEKKALVEEIDLNVQITRKLSAFLRENMEAFLNYDRIVVYYDYGQRELANILASVLNAVLGNVEFKKVSPADYKLFQAADMLCTLELLSLKMERNMLSNSEIAFFKSARILSKSFIDAIRKKKFK